MVYEVSSPGEQYTFETDDFEVAALTMFSLGNLYGAVCGTESEDDIMSIPVFVFGGASEWYQKQFGRSSDEGHKEKGEAVAEALDSIVLGDFDDRQEYNSALSVIADAEKREIYISEWQSRKISLHDICAKARERAENIRGIESAEKVV